MNLFLNSCVDEAAAPKIEVSENAQLVSVKTWFEENKTKLRLPERNSNFRTESQELILPFFEKEPDWDKFHHYYFADGREVFEINLENEQLYVPLRASTEDIKVTAQQVIQNILFVKHHTENRFDPLIVRYYPNEETSMRDFKEINYQMIDEKWSGIVDLFTYDEHHFIGFEIEKGQILTTRNIEAKANGDRKYIGKENMDVRCSVTTTDWYQISYVTQTNTWVVQQLSSTSTRSCSGGGDGAHNDVSSSGGSHSYGGTPSYGGGTPSYGGGSSGYSPPEVPMQKLTIYIDSSITSNSRLDCIVDKLSMTGFVKDIAEFTKTGNFIRNSVIKLDQLGSKVNGQTTKSNGSYAITINSN